MSSRIIRGNSTETDKIKPFRLDPDIHRPADPSFAPGPEKDSISPELSALLAISDQVAPGGEASIRISELEKDAYQQGFTEGQKAGSEIGEKMAAALLERYSKTLDELNQLRREVLMTSEHEVIRLALEIARKVIKREIAIDEEIVLTLVKVALKRVSDQTLITVRLNPKDCNIVKRYQSVRTESDSLSDGIKLAEDPLISRGSCVIETESGIIDARVEEQLREIEKGFFE
jgi:flagellar assembly protein FliH